MNYSNIFKKIAISLSTIFTVTMLTANFAGALPYTGSTTVASPIPAFDVFTSTPGYPLPAPAPSDSESNFLQARVPINGNPAADSTTPYADPLSTGCTNGEIIQLRVYIHNGANAEFNNNGTGPSVAHNTQVQVTIPDSQSTAFETGASISSSNAATVSDNLAINCTGNQAVELQYVPGSASQYSVATNAATPLSDSIVTTGDLVQSETVPGDVWGCWNDRVLVVLSVKIVVPSTPITPPTPPTPPVLVNTGPGNVVGVFMGASLIAGTGYYLRSRRAVSK
jgi:hypothetical protein